MAQLLRATIVGDVIASRQAGEREELQQVLRRSLGAVNDSVPPVQPLTITIGDEFQGAYLRMEDALRGSLLLQLQLKGTADIRAGLGWGELFFGEETSPLDQDGPCWWRAREALEWIGRLGGSRGVARSRRTACRTGTSWDSTLNGYLAMRDEVMSGIDETDARIIFGLLAGQSQTEIAAQLHMNKSSVNRRVQGHGLLAVVSSLPTDIELGPL